MKNQIVLVIVGLLSVGACFFGLPDEVALVGATVALFATISLVTELILSFNDEHFYSDTVSRSYLIFARLDLLYFLAAAGSVVYILW